MARLTFFALMLLPLVTEAQVCNHKQQLQVVQHHAQQQIVALPVLSYPQVQYQVGQNIEQESIAELVVEKLLARQQYRSPQQFCPDCQTQPKQSDNTLQLRLPPPTGQFSCSKCHSGSTAKAGLVFDGQTPIDCETALHGVATILNGTMPRGTKLTEQQKLETIATILSTHSLSKTPPPPVPDDPDRIDLRTWEPQPNPLDAPRTSPLRSMSPQGKLNLLQKLQGLLSGLK